MACNFGELRGRDGARGVGLGEDDFRGERKERAGNFVDGLVAEGAKNEDSFRPAKFSSR